MQALYAFPQTQLLAFALVMLRLSVFVVIWPVFSVYNVPHHAKVLFALMVAFVIFPLVGWKQIAGDLASTQLAWMVMREVFIGLTLGFITRTFFFAVSASGEMISTAMGLSSASLMNPAINSQGTAMEQIKVVLATLIFLAIDGHHVFLQGLIKSYEIVPLGTSGLEFLQTGYLAEMIQSVMVAALKLSAPVMIAILILNITMGIVGRAVPQINVLVMSLPVTLLGGLLVTMVCLPLYCDQLKGVFNQMAEGLFAALKTW